MGKQHDKMMRLCSLNSALRAQTMIFAQNHTKLQFDLYLDKHRANQYKEVTMYDLRASTDMKQSYFLSKAWSSYTGIWHEFRNGFGHCNMDGMITMLVALATFVAGPIYFLSRFVNVLFLIFIVLYLYFGYDTNIWTTDTIDPFQVSLISVYLAMNVVVFMLFISNCRE